MKKFIYTLITILLFFGTGCSTKKEIASKGKNIIDGHEYVDLGLPSGRLWATCNVGSTKPEELGDRFAWGETKPKKVYNWDTYKFAKEVIPYITKNEYTGKPDTNLVRIPGAGCCEVRMLWMLFKTT